MFEHMKMETLQGIFVSITWVFLLFRGLGLTLRASGAQGSNLWTVSDKRNTTLKPNPEFGTLNFSKGSHPCKYIGIPTNFGYWICHTFQTVNLEH